MRNISLRSKFLIGTVGSVLLVGLIVIILVQVLLTKELLSEYQKKGILITQDITRECVDPILTESMLELQMLVNDRRRASDEVEYIFILDAYGEILAHTFEEGFPYDLRSANVVGTGETYSVRPLVTEKGTIFDIAVPILRGSAGVVHLGIAKEHVTKEVADLIRPIVALIMAAVVLGGGLAVVSATILTKPIVELTKATKAVAGGGLEHKVCVRSKDEIGQLATAFNSMQEKISERTENLTKTNEELQKEIVERKQTEEQLEIAKHKAEEANQTKSQFLANMSHEIRTPMNAIIGFSDLLAEEGLNEQQKEYLNFIINSGQNLLELIEDILDFSKIEAGQLDIEIIDCSLAKLLNSVESLMRPVATEKELEFEIIETSALPAQIKTDPTRLRQCLINLVNNAVKFTERGHVHVKVWLEECENMSFIRFDVEDTGIGVPEDKQAMIFESFTQADESHTRKYGGTGLGLAITKQLAELLGGKLTLTSQIGKGSVFSLTIPANVDITKQPLLDRNDIASHTDISEEKAGQSEFYGKILVAEDAPTNQILIKSLLEQMGLQVTIAEDGNEAVQKIMVQEFDMVFMDMMMPNMNGYEATKEIRKKGIKTPIVALTANAMKGDNKKCFEAGCDDYLAKPIERKELLKIIGKYLLSKEPALIGTPDSQKS